MPQVANLLLRTRANKELLSAERSPTEIVPPPSDQELDWALDFASNPCKVPKKPMTTLPACSSFADARTKLAENKTDILRQITNADYWRIHNCLAHLARLGEKLPLQQMEGAGLVFSDAIEPFSPYFHTLMYIPWSAAPAGSKFAEEVILGAYFERLHINRACAPPRRTAQIADLCEGLQLGAANKRVKVAAV